MGVRIQLLGGFAVTVDGVRVPDAVWRHSRPRDLVQLLALSPGHRMPGEQLLGLLWPDLDPMAARSNLHKAAHLARRAVDSPDGVVLALGMVELFPGTECTVDVEEFELAARSALGSGDREQADRARAAYTGDLLPDQRYTGWAEPVRERLRALYVQLAHEAGDPEAAVATDPLDEHAHVALVRAALDENRPAEALRRYARLAHAFRRELDRAPGEEARALRDEAARQVAPRPVLPALAGRSAEVARLRELMLRAQTGTGGVLLVEGGPGLGKTRLLDELVAEATDAGWPTARASADTALPAPYGPVVDAVVRLLRHRPDIADPDPGTVRARLEELTAQDEQPLSPSPVARDGHLEDLVTTLAGVLAPRGLGTQAMLVLDDAHAADVGTLDLVRQLAQICDDEPLVVVLGYRAPAPRSALHALRGMLLQRGAARLQLAPLGEDDARALVRQAAVRPPEQATLERLVRLGEGNPLLLRELALQVADDGTAPTPLDLDDVVLSRLARVSGEAAVALERVAVVHGSFTREEFTAAAGLSGDVGDRLLEECLAHETLVRTPDGFGFAHALLRDAFAGLVPAPRQRTLHEETARRLVDRGADAGRIAYHYEQAGIADAASTWLAEAAEHAASTGAFGDALGFADRGLAQAPEAGRPRLLELRADALQALGRPGAADAYLEVRRIAPAGDRDRLLVKQANAYLDAGDLAAARVCLDSVSPDVPDEVAVHLALARGFVAWSTGDLEESRRWAAEARATAVREARSFEAGEALLLELLVAHSSGEWDLTGLPHAMRELSVPEVASKAWDPHLCIGIYLVGAEEPYDEVADLMRGTARAAAESGVLRAEAFAFTVLGGAAVFAGDGTQAREALGRALRLQRRCGSSSGQSVVLERMAALAHLQGDVLTARSLLEDAERMARSTVLTPHLLVRTHATRIENAASPDQALRLVDAAERDLAEHELCRGCSPQFLLTAAGACLTAGDGGRAADLVDRVRGMGPSVRTGVWAAAITEVDAGLAMLRGAVDEGVELLHEAERRYTRCGHLVAAQRCRTVLTAARKDSGSPAS